MCGVCGWGGGWWGVELGGRLSDVILWVGGGLCVELSVGGGGWCGVGCWGGVGCGVGGLWVRRGSIVRLRRIDSVCPLAVRV